MKNKKLFDRTVSILVKAYQNDTLQRGNCYACAVGNIVAANMGFKMIPNPDINTYHTGNVENPFVWDSLFYLNNVLTRHCNSNASDEQLELVKEQLASTGYTLKEIESIETAFERTPRGVSGDFMFNGLMSVIDTLMEIHEATTEEATHAKELFVKVSV